MGDDDKGTGTEETFTRAQVRAMIAAEVRKARESFADYDELKAAAAAAGKDKSQLDKLTEQISALTRRAETADLEVARRDVADEFGLTRREARRLSGKSADELRTDAQELVDDLGIDVAARKAGKGSKTTKTDSDNGADSEGDGEGSTGGTGSTGDSGAQDGDDDASKRTPPARPGRPRETLRSGAPRTEDTDANLETMDPLELVAKVPRR